MDTSIDTFATALIRRFGDRAHAVALEQARLAETGSMAITMWPEIAERVAFLIPDPGIEIVTSIPAAVG